MTGPVSPGESDATAANAEIDRLLARSSLGGQGASLLRQRGSPVDAALIQSLANDQDALVAADTTSFALSQEQLHSVLETLSEREAGVVAMRFGLTDGQPKTLDEVSKVYGVTRERIRQIESKTMSKLRRPSTQPSEPQAGD